MPHVPLQQAHVTLLQALDHGVLFTGSGPVNARCQQRNDRLCDKQGNDQGHHDGDRHVGQEDGDLVLFTKDDRQKHGRAGHRTGRNREPNGADTAQRGAPGVIRGFFMLGVNALTDHHGVVDQHAHRQHQPHHRKNIQRQAQEIHHPQGDGDGNRHGQRNHQRGLDTAQEKIQNEQ